MPEEIEDMFFSTPEDGDLLDLLANNFTIHYQELVRLAMSLIMFFLKCP